MEANGVGGVPPEVAAREALQDDEAVVVVEQGDASQSADNPAVAGALTVTIGKDGEPINPAAAAPDAAGGQDGEGGDGAPVAAEGENAEVSPKVEPPKQLFETADAFIAEAKELGDVLLAERNFQVAEFKKIKEANGESLTMAQVEPLLAVLDNIIENIGVMEQEYNSFHASSPQAAEAMKAFEVLREENIVLQTQIVESLEITTDLLKVQSEGMLNDFLNDWAGDDPKKQAQAESIKNGIKVLGIIAGFTYDQFKNIVEEADLGLFLSFVFDPTGTFSGKEFRFGNHNFGERKAEVVVAHQFSHKFKDTQQVGVALQKSVQKLNLGSWTEENRENLNKVASEDNPQVLQVLLVDIYKNFLNKSESESKWEAFQLEFTTELFGGGKDTFAGDDCKEFLEEKLKNDGEKLKLFWKIK